MKLTDEGNALIQALKAIKMQKSPLDGLLTIEELSDYLKKSKGTIYNWVSQRKIPYQKVGKSLRFSDRDIKNWLDQNAVREVM